MMVLYMTTFVSSYFLFNSTLVIFYDCQEYFRWFLSKVFSGLECQNISRSYYLMRNRTKNEVEQHLLKILPECFRRIARMLFKEADKIRCVLVAEVISNLIDLVGGSEKISFSLKQDVFVDQLRTSFSQH